MAQREIVPVPIARTKSLKVADESKQEELARGVIRRYFLSQTSRDAKSKDEASDDSPIIPSPDGELLLDPPTVGESSHSLSHTSTPCTAAKPKRLALASTPPSLSPIQSPSNQPHSREDDSALDVAEGQATFTRGTPLRHSAVVLSSSASAERLADEDHRAPRSSQSEAHRLRSSSCVYPSLGTHIPPDQRELVPMQIADMLRHIADHEVEPALRRQGLLDQMGRRADMQTLPHRATLEQQLEWLIQDERLHNQNGGPLDSAVMYWAQGLVWANAVLQGLGAAHSSQMEELQQVLEDALVDVFRKHRLMWWLGSPLGFFTACKNRVGAVVTSCIGHLATWSPQLLRRRMLPVARRPSAEGAGEQIGESGFFDHSTSLPTTPTMTPTAPPRRTSSISDLVTNPLVTASASAVGAAASYMLTNTM